MSAVRFLLQRYLFPYRGSLLTLALWVSVLGVALGIVQLMLVLSVMSGFQSFLQKHYTQITSDIVVIPRQSNGSARRIVDEVRKHPWIEAYTTFGLAQAMLIKSGVGGVTLEGIDLKTTSQVTDWKKIWVAPPLEELQQKNPHWIWVGKQIAEKLGVKPGDEVEVMVADGSKTKTFPFVVTAITRFGIYDHDLRYARVSQQAFQDLFPEFHTEPMFKLKLSPSTSMEVAVNELREKLGKVASVKPWNEIHQNVFLAVEHQKRMLFLVLEIVVALAAMNVVNLLLMSSHHRRRDVAILRSMGMRFGQTLAFFVAQGTAVGIGGVALGIVMGLFVCEAVSRWQPSLLSESVYNVTRLPIKVELNDVTLISVVAILLCVVCSVLPALKAARSRPVEALKYD